MVGAVHGTTTSLYEAANALQQHHQDSISQLYSLTANLGLLQVSIPPDMTESEKEFVKQLILLHAVKTSLWNRLQRYQDEMNPIRKSATRSGAGRTLGTKKLQGAIKAVQNRGKGIMVWASEMELPAHLDRQQVISVDPDAPLWEEMSLGSTWVTLWGSRYEAAPAYTRDPRVRQGIKMVLQLDRVAEEEERLVDERRNMLDEFTAAFLRIATVRKQLQDSMFAHRMYLQLMRLLTERRNLIRGRDIPKTALWQLVPVEILKYLEGDGPINRLLQPLHNFFETTKLPQDKAESVIMGDEVPDDEDIDDFAWESRSDTSCSVDSDDQEDRLDADTLTELSYGMQKLNAGDGGIGIRLPASMTCHQSQRFLMPSITTVTMLTTLTPKTTHTTMSSRSGRLRHLR
ncbi:hypothetical protein K439DRAFT_375806 [Ramaria rubella]|nr:hypothetical protein K439DRAFT_375806 [Ramaria rubella]